MERGPRGGGMSRKGKEGEGKKFKMCNAHVNMH